MSDFDTFVASLRLRQARDARKTRGLRGELGGTTNLVTGNFVSE